MNRTQKIYIFLIQIPDTLKTEVIGSSQRKWKIWAILGNFGTQVSFNHISCFLRKKFNFIKSYIFIFPRVNGVDQLNAPKVIQIFSPI